MKTLAKMFNNIILLSQTFIQKQPLQCKSSTHSNLEILLMKHTLFELCSELVNIMLCCFQQVDHSRHWKVLKDLQRNSDTCNKFYFFRWQNTWKNSTQSKRLQTLLDAAQGLSGTWSRMVKSTLSHFVNIMTKLERSVQSKGFLNHQSKSLQVQNSFI